MIEIKIGRTAIIVLALMALLLLWDRPSSTGEEGIELPPQAPPPSIRWVNNPDLRRKRFITEN
jgi:hypothetical protein